jgi:predicted DNA binding CopG/RHH family protein
MIQKKADIQNSELISVRVPKYVFEYIKRKKENEGITFQEAIRKMLEFHLSAPNKKNSKNEIQSDDL